MNIDYRKGVLYCIIATVSWGVMFPIMTSALTRVDPFTFTSLRYGFALIPFLIVLLYREGRNALNLKGERFGLAWLLGTIGFVGFGFFVFLGQKLAGPDGALTASIMMATMPMLGVLVNWAIRRVAPPAVSVAFIIMSFCGVVTVVTKGHYSSLIEHPQAYGADLLIILGALCWVIYTVGPTFFPKWSAYRYTAVTTLLGVPSVLAINAALYVSGVVPVPSAADFRFIAPHVAYMSMIAGFVGVLCWNLGNRILTPLNGTLFMDVVPITAFLLSTTQGVVPVGAQITGACITGTALIFNNIFMRQRLLASVAATQAVKASPRA